MENIQRMLKSENLKINSTSADKFSARWSRNGQRVADGIEIDGQEYQPHSLLEPSRLKNPSGPSYHPDSINDFQKICCELQPETCIGTSHGFKNRIWTLLG